ERPFQLVAAPWLDAARVVESVPLTPFRGVRLHRDEVMPSMAPHAGVPCPAIRVEIVDRARVRPVSLALALLAAIMRNHPRDFTWSPYPTAANPSGAWHFERLVGRHDIRERLMDPDRPLAPTTIASWTGARRWRDEVRAHLLYG
ncbi:MAG TPA: hypothetical protein VFX50_05545, partial [Gemmatimonadales bacterium]|nr:hypothetical protein [Gemmatimonadales bacterium]